MLKELPDIIEHVITCLGNKTIISCLVETKVVTIVFQGCGQPDSVLVSCRPQHQDSTRLHKMRFFLSSCETDLSRFWDLLGREKFQSYNQKICFKVNMKLNSPVYRPSVYIKHQY